MFCPSVGGASKGVPSAALRHGRERQLLLAAGHLPESEMTVSRQLAQRARVRQRFEFAARKIRAQREVLHTRDFRLDTRRHDAQGGLLVQAFHQPQTQPQCGLVVGALDARACNPNDCCRR